MPNALRLLHRLPVTDLQLYPAGLSFSDLSDGLSGYYTRDALLLASPVGKDALSVPLSWP